MKSDLLMISLNVTDIFLPSLGEISICIHDKNFSAVLDYMLYNGEISNQQKKKKKKTSRSDGYNK